MPRTVPVPSFVRVPTAPAGSRHLRGGRNRTGRPHVAYLRGSSRSRHPAPKCGSWPGRCWPARSRRTRTGCARWPWPAGRCPSGSNQYFAAATCAGRGPVLGRPAATLATLITTSPGGTRWTRWPARCRPAGAAPSRAAGHDGRLDRGDELWLIRTALIYQLGYRERTDPQALFGYCRCAPASGFSSARRSAGRAAYAKTDPDAVRAFVAHALSGMSGGRRSRILGRASNSTGRRRVVGSTGTGGS